MKADQPLILREEISGTIEQKFEHRAGEVELEPRAIQRRAGSNKTLSTPSATRSAGTNRLFDLPITAQNPLEVTIPNDNS
ncbi:MAG: hypothetical protein AAF388_12695, partial [Bacteroidota bacterium]